MGADRADPRVVRLTASPAARRVTTSAAPSSQITERAMPSSRLLHGWLAVVRGFQSENFSDLRGASGKLKALRAIIFWKQIVIGIIATGWALAALGTEPKYAVLVRESVCDPTSSRASDELIKSPAKKSGCARRDPG